MDIIEATEISIHRKVGDKEYEFRFLTAYDRAELLRDDLEARQAARADRKAKLIDNLKLADIEKEQMFAELEAFDDQFPEEVTEQDWINLVNNPLHEIAIFTRSLAKTYPAEAEAIAKASAINLADKAKLCGLTLVSRSREETPDPNLQGGRPVAYVTPEPENSTGEKPIAA